MKFMLIEKIKKLSFLLILVGALSNAWGGQVVKQCIPVSNFFNTYTAPTLCDASKINAKYNLPIDSASKCLNADFSEKVQINGKSRLVYGQIVYQYARETDGRTNKPVLPDCNDKDAISFWEE